MFKSRTTSRSLSSSPHKSATSSLPETHIIQDRYRSYHRAEDYIKHLNNVYNSHVVTSGVYDEAYFSAFQFKSQEPKLNAKFKVSQFPRSKVNEELLQQQELVNAFNHIGNEERPKSRARPRSTIPRTVRRDSVDRTFFSYKKVRRLENEKCDECGKSNCQCLKMVQDNFLKKALKKHLKIRQKSENGSDYGLKPNRPNVFVLEKREKSFLLKEGERDGKEKISLNSKTEKHFTRVNKRINASMRMGIEDSLNISPVNISHREGLKKKYNKLSVFKEYLQEKLSEEKSCKKSNAKYL
jgi:hypothetical protein